MQLSITLLLLAIVTARADFRIARGGEASCVILRQADATEPEVKAAEDLARTLSEITGARFDLQVAGENIPKRAIVIGPGAVAATFFPEVPFDELGPEEIVMRVKEDKLLLAGGRPRGTMYAVYRFLQEQCGVRYWTAWAAHVPKNPNLTVPELDIRHAPPFEYRHTFWHPAFDPRWQVRNQSNGEHRRGAPEFGGSIKIEGFAHTFYKLVPPEKHFETNPEWFSLINGKRTRQHAQLCLTNPQLREFVVRRVRRRLRDSPEARIVSVSQNDWFGPCRCADCKAVDDAEGSHAGTMIDFVNFVAEKIEDEFPGVAVDTFAYQYTRKPPKTLRPRHNVIVRLCSIECNFREPLDHPSNAAFADDIRRWSRIAPRLYVWDYTIDFNNYIHPHPNWFTLGPNIRFFQEHGVKGLFEQGAYSGHGAEMAEMRAWVLAQLMWNPQQDDRALIREFLEGYYGEEAAGLIYQYFELIHQASEGVFVGCFLRREPPRHLHFPVLNQAESLWRRAEEAVAGDPEKLSRVRIARLPVRYAFLKYWNWLRDDCRDHGMEWPLPESRAEVAREFRAVCEGVPGKEWTQVRVLSERGPSLDEFLKPFEEDAEAPDPPRPRLKNPPPPADLRGVGRARAVDLQDNRATLSGYGTWAEFRYDGAASDERAVWMDGNHSRWAFQIHNRELPARARSGKWKVYAVVRVEKSGKPADAQSVAFSAGVFDKRERTYPANFRARLGEAGAEYRSYLLGEVEMNRHSEFFVAPAANPGVKAIWVDRIYMVPGN